MQAALSRELISVEDYLASEEAGEIKHEYVGGVVYAMAGASVEHNQIAGNIYAAFLQALRGRPCRPFISDIKLRIEALGEDAFYYPDVMVGCDPRDTQRLFLRYPKVIVEVASASTERLDRREKRWAYQTIETLEEYVIVAQDRVEAIIFRRANQWKAETYKRMEDLLTFKSLGLTLPLSAIYEGATPK